METYTRMRQAAAAPGLGLNQLMKPVTDFVRDSERFVRRCHRPDRREFLKVAARTALGMTVVGFVGFFVKLISIPLNSIILAR